MLNDMLKYNLKIAVLSLLLMAVLGSCDSDDDSSSQVTLLSFGPSGVQHGDKIKFIGTNLDKVTAIVLPGDIEIPASAFTSKSKTLIELVVPEEAQAGKVTLKTPQGDIESKSILSFLVPVEINTMPGQAKPGTNITITGKFVDWIESVTFNNGATVTDFVSKTLNELVLTVPMEAKTGFVVFETGGTKPLTLTTIGQFVVTLPTFTSISPMSVKHTENLTITGTDLDLVTSVKFPDGSIVPAGSFVSQSLTEIVVAVPATSTSGKLALNVASEVAVSSEDAIEIILPVVTSFSPSDPSSQEVEGTTLTMTGTNLDLVAKIKFPGVSTLVTSFTKTETSIVVTVPAGAQGGTMVFTTIHDFVVPVTAPFGNQLTLLKTIFDDGLKNNFGKGGWGSPDIANAENVRVGTVAIKSTFTGGYSGGGQFGTWSNPALSTDGTTYLAFSIYGGSGTNGKTLLVNIAGATQQQVTVDEGKWKDVKIALSSMGSPASITEISFQDADWSGVVYIDQIGLK
jgi:hypothetical protein